MEDKQIAQNYAKALFELEASETIIAELKAVSDLFATKVGLTDFFNDGLATDEQKKEWVEKYLTIFSQQMRNFILVLDSKKRISLLPEIRLNYENHYLAKQNTERIIITTATAVSKAELAKIITCFEQKTKKKLIEEHIIDKSIIGGVRVQIGSQLYDDTIELKLQSVMRKFEKEV
ncbi:MAG: ATP synthase F1 subunit delta [Culicoidibacterales bacterium]